jgi:hypothetical protein
MASGKMQSAKTGSQGKAKMPSAGARKASGMAGKAGSSAARRKAN